MRLRQLVSAIAVTLVAGSCRLGEPTDSAVINVFVGVSDAQLGVGEEMTITVTARNVGFEPVVLSGPPGCTLYIDVVDTQGSIVWTNGQCPGGAVTEELVVGVDKVQTFTWRGENQAGARLPGGFYHIRAVARLSGSRYFGPPISVSLE